MDTGLFQQILDAAALERDRVARGQSLISRDQCVAELSEMGMMRWYLHGALTNSSTHSLYFYELEIPAGSRSGKLRCQGGIVHLVLQGSGKTTVDDVDHRWEPNDVIAVPVKEMGVTYQHFNDSCTTARLLVAWPNLDSFIGPEGGVEMKVLEPAPEYASSAATHDPEEVA